MTIWFSKKKLVLYFDKSKLASKRTGILADILSNVLNLRIFSAQNIEIIGYKNVVDKSAIATVKSWNMGNYQEIVSAILFLILEIVAIGYALKLWFINKITHHSTAHTCSITKMVTATSCRCKNGRRLERKMRKCSSRSRNGTIMATRDDGVESMGVHPLPGSTAG